MTELYADTNCSYTEQSIHGEQYYTFTGPCFVTGKTVSVSVRGDELFHLRQGAHIQNALVSNTDNEREFLLTGISADGWNMLFADDNDEEEGA